jgi:hypothetical protein
MPDKVAGTRGPDATQVQPGWAVAIPLHQCGMNQVVKWLLHSLYLRHVLATQLECPVFLICWAISSGVAPDKQKPFVDLPPTTAGKVSLTC